jgi:flagellar basal body-associated protein FliL
MLHQTPKQLVRIVMRQLFKRLHLSLLLLICLTLTTVSNAKPGEEAHKELLSTLPKFHKMKIIETTMALSSDDTHIPVLQLRLSLMAENLEDILLVKYHEPLYRSAVILYLNKLTKYDLTTSSQKRTLKLELLKIINTNIQKETSRSNIVKRVLITKMVIE